MKILVNNVLDKPDGCSLYRNLIPFEALSSLGWEIRYLPTDDNFEPDIVWFNRMYGKGIEEFVDIAKRHKKKIVFECDDLIDKIPLDNPANLHPDIKNLVKGFRYILRQADLVTTTTDFLKQELQKRTDSKIEVIPNSVRDFLIRENKPGIRIGYAGGTSHYRDLDFILDVILDLQNKYDFEFITLGVGEEKEFENYKDYPNVYKYYKSVNEKLKKVKNYSYQKPVNVFHYQETLSKLDLTIGLCPLQDNTFSKCKSSIKYYEYASVGTVTLASYVEAYKDCNYTAFRFHEWKNKLERLITEKDFRYNLLKSQMNYVANYRSIDVVKDRWNEVLTSLLKK